MANENDSRPAPENGDVGGNGPRTHPAKTLSESTTQESTKAPRTATIPTLNAVAAELRSVHRHLTLVMSLVVVSTVALEAQNADNDIDVATVLKHSVAAKLYKQIERIADLAARCERAAS